MSDFLISIGFNGPVVYIISFLLSIVIFFLFQWKRDLDIQLKSLNGRDKDVYKKLENATCKSSDTHRDMMLDIRKMISETAAGFDDKFNAVRSARDSSLKTHFDAMNGKLELVASTGKENTNDINNVKQQIVKVGFDYSLQMSKLKDCGLSEEEIKARVDIIESELVNKIQISIGELTSVSSKVTSEEVRLIRNDLLKYKKEQSKRSHNLNSEIKANSMMNDKKIQMMAAAIKKVNEENSSLKDRVQKLERSEIKSNKIRLKG